MIDINTKTYIRDRVFIVLSFKIAFNTLFSCLDSAKAY